MTARPGRRGARGRGSPGEAPVVDVAHLRGFTDGDTQLEQELGALFLSTAGLYVERMAAALDAGGGGDWSAAAHALKGASANLGARRVAALAAAAEGTAPSPAALSALRRALDEVRAFFAPAKARRRPRAAGPGGRSGGAPRVPGAE